MKARAGVQMLSKIVVAKLATVKDVFLTSVKVAITLIPPVLLVSKVLNPSLYLAMTGIDDRDPRILRAIVKPTKQALHQ
ncbi:MULTISPECIES: hypothetical protein [unclassified Microcoleus]|uniref:hypothetical protein n=1 Tax=unclassified Microcoleus TaxID=2642155 RepID=UPI0025FC13D7|nr:MULTISPECIES: hypothetical protein [unclassified Microcoleus]